EAVKLFLRMSEKIPNGPQEIAVRRMPAETEPHHLAWLLCLRPKRRYNWCSRCQEHRVCVRIATSTMGDTKQSLPKLATSDHGIGSVWSIPARHREYDP